MLNKVSRFLLASSLAFLFSEISFAKTYEGIWDLHLYPAGIITSFGYVLKRDQEKSLSLHLGYNKTDRRDFGKNDEEAGGGPGISVQYIRNYDRWFKTGFFGGRIDYWILEIDWIDGNDSGRATAHVLQPTVEIGSEVKIGQGSRLRFSGGLGSEINVYKSGKPVGEGLIGLIRFGWTKGFSW